MTREKIPISEILIEDRQRLSYGDLDDLADSLTRYGLIQPIVLNQARRLIAGGRRLAAASSLGWTTIDVVFRETLSVDELHELELEENVRRKEMTWQERCLNVATIHSLKQKRAALESRSWGQRETGELLGENLAQVSFALIIAKKLRDELDLATKTFFPTARYAKCENFWSAWQLKLRDEIDENTAELAHRQALSSATPEQELHDKLLIEFVDNVSSSPDALAEERTRYESNPHNTTPFEVYWSEKQVLAKQVVDTIYLSNKLVRGDSIEYMNEHKGVYDHVITDIPYAIDINNLDQQRGIVNIDTIEELHDVDYNLQLIADFFPAAYNTLKDYGFCITWADQMLWQYMYDHAVKAGFSVQRWPITWVKTHNCLNQCANFNFTKNTEIAIVCRKKNTTLVNKQSDCVVHAGRDELCESIGHPFAKPFECWRYLVEAVSLEGQSILEPFAGRGSGVISMLRLKRNVVGVELDDNHYNALLENLKQEYLKLNPNLIFK